MSRPVTPAGPADPGIPGAISPASPGAGNAADAGAGGERQRIDRWLWCARFFKTRSLAARVVAAGHVRVNGTRVSRPAHLLRPGDVLTFQQARVIRVVCVAALATRRGPASEARGLFIDNSPPMKPGPGGGDARKPNPAPDKAPDGRSRARLRTLKRQG